MLGRERCRLTRDLFSSSPWERRCRLGTQRQAGFDETDKPHQEEETGRG